MTAPYQPERDLGTILEELRHDVDRLTAVVHDLPGKVEELGGGLDEAHRLLEGVARRSAEAEVGVRELGVLVKRLDARVEWLERNIRMHDPSAVVVELDDVPPDLFRLAELADRGQRAQLALLPASSRAALEKAVEEHADAVRERARHLDDALAASRTLASTERGEEVHASAVGEFRSAAAAFAAARRRCAELVRPAVEAAEELSADEERRAEQAEVIGTGERAWRELLGRLRSRVAEAVGEGALLPAWFTSVLGPIPPAEDTGAWMDAATGMLAYRVSYEVTDPVLPLGADPDDRAGARRKGWHAQLKRQLRDLQR